MNTTADFLDTISERRTSQRATFFLVPVARERVPVWVFTAVAPGEGFAGLVLDMSDSGLKLLVEADATLRADRYDLRLVLGEDDDVPPFDGVVRLAWSEAPTLAGRVCGVEFEREDASARLFIGAFLDDSRPGRWVRCVMTPRTGLR
jgi:hypothetical protein